VVAQAGYLEVLTFALCSHDDGFKFMRRPDDGKTACVIGNPATAEFEIARINLLSGLLTTIKENKEKPMPIKIFEVQDVVLLDETDVGDVTPQAIRPCARARARARTRARARAHACTLPLISS
jgi:phenylalanyl-tRNA synthetase beta chain